MTMNRFSTFGSGRTLISSDLWNRWHLDASGAANIFRVSEVVVNNRFTDLLRKQATRVLPAPSAGCTCSGVSASHERS
jgi:hypothetical protein